ncbi:hypothetical protein VTK73DRAFT_4631 [Phialemonium thermophilum]|uniref:Elongation of fatty acids protein n=1 Tax=Phialemonium thermophilum TaxID=223376 RepID=A0ABR3WSG1_9PEZI
MSAFPSVTAALPDPALFAFPPSSTPTFLPPPPPSSMPAAPPIAIPDHIYQALLDPKVPVTIAALYTVAAKSLNAYNRSTGKRPWAISKTRAFSAFVVLHNIFLAVYSAWTWWGMYGALRRTVVSPLGPDGLAGFADSICRMHGPAGLGQSVFFSEEAGTWKSFASNATLTSSGEPLRTDTGRLWNEGLAFYGWLFYLSKFYEVLDTFVILAKGKFSSTLQTYHHAGAMMCMWAGMRYMSPPIWMFVFFNSGIHAMMYTYFTLTAFSVKVPQVIKRTLTSLQISQFVIGGSYAIVHSFVTYTVPVMVENSAGAAASTTYSSAAEAATATAAHLLDSVKRFVFGDESVASAAPSRAPSAITVEYRTIPCINTTGSTFAIWLNVVYLAPLTYLFVKFFITSYIRRSSAEQERARKDEKAGVRDRRLSNVSLAEKAGWDAARDVEREVYGENDQEDPSRLSANVRARANGKSAAKRRNRA